MIFKKNFLLFTLFLGCAFNTHSQNDINILLKYYSIAPSSISALDVDGVIKKKIDGKTYVLDDYILGNPINAKFFGVKADGITDDTSNLQTAINTCNKLGLVLFLPAGVIITSSDVNIYLDNNSSTKFKIIGSGINTTKIINIGNKTKIALNVTGNYYDMFSMRDFSLQRIDEGKPTGDIGLKINKLVYSDFINIDVFRFSTGIVLNDISSSYFRNVNARWGGQGMYLTLEKNGMSNPNLLQFQSCIFNSNLEWGLKIDNAHDVNISSCLFEDNGKGGIYSTYNNSNGAVSINVRDSYFETNRGYDIYLFSSGRGSHNFSGNTFNRVSNTKYTDNNIVVEISKLVPVSYENTVTTIGNGFFSANTYQPNKDRKYIKIINNSNSKINFSEDNNYNNSIEK